MFSRLKHTYRHYTHLNTLNNYYYTRRLYSSELKLSHQQLKNLQYYSLRHLFENIKMNPNNEQQIPEVDPKTGEIIINPLKEDGTEKTPKEIEKEKKKAEKMLKFLAKQAKKAAPAANKSEKKEKKKAEKPVEVIPDFVDKTGAGEKKILLPLDDPSLKIYNPSNVESSWYSYWVKSGAFDPEFTEDGNIKPEGVFSIPAPPPNVTGALHIGHALTIAIQDSLIRYNRMKGKTVLFLPGFDHAGIATQSVVEKKIWANEKKTRHDFSREEFVGKVWDWKEVYHQKIKSQITRLGASYDWSREAFTLSPELTKSVEEAFIRLHDDGTIYRASRLVNWSVKLNTAISNLEVENKEVKGRTELSIPGYDEKVEFGVITSFAYPVVDSKIQALAR